MAESFDEIAKKVEDKGGLMTLPMWRLRDANGSDRLGKYVIASISKELDDRGIGHWPKELGLDQNGRARLYKKKSGVGAVIAALDDFSNDGDKVLRSISNNDAEKVLNKIRELVCE